MPVDMSASVAVAGRPDRRSPRPWLINPTVDLALVFGVGVLFSAVLYVCWRAGSGFLVVAAVFAVLLDFPHVLWTSVRVGLDPRERALHGRHFLVSLGVITAAVAALAGTGHFLVVVVVFVLWQVWHVVRQHLGVVSVYAAKAGYRGSRAPAKRVLVAGCLAPVLYRAAQGLQLGHYVVGGRVLPFSDLTVPLPPVPAALVVAAYAAFAVLAVRFAAQQVGHRRHGERPLPAVALLTIAVAVAFYNASYLLVSDPYALILIATTFHSLQYHVISWARNYGRFTINAGTDEERLLLSQLTCPKSVVPLGLVLVVTGGLLASGEFVLAGVVPFSIVLHHFYLDGVLWKPSANPDLARDLAIGPRRTSG